MSEELVTFNVTRFAWDCSRCGTVKGEEWEPSLVVIGQETFKETA